MSLFNNLLTIALRFTQTYLFANEFYFPILIIGSLLVGCGQSGAVRELSSFRRNYLSVPYEMPLEELASRLEIPTAFLSYINELTDKTIIVPGQSIMVPFYQDVFPNYSSLLTRSSVLALNSRGGNIGNSWLVPSFFHPLLFVWPVPGADPGSPFGFRNGRPHRGVDVPAASYTPVFVVAQGEVSECGWRGEFGNSIIVRHKGFLSRYAHLSAISVTEGDQVEAGENIGAVGATGNASGPHLHFEIFIDSVGHSGRTYRQHVNPLVLY